MVFNVTQLDTNFDRFTSITSNDSWRTSGGKKGVHKVAQILFHNYLTSWPCQYTSILLFRYVGFLCWLLTVNGMDSFPPQSEPNSSVINKHLATATRFANRFHRFIMWVFAVWMRIAVCMLMMQAWQKSLSSAI